MANALVSGAGAGPLYGPTWRVHSRQWTLPAGSGEAAHMAAAGTA